jgi:hypothetical protein
MENGAPEDVLVPTNSSLVNSQKKSFWVLFTLLSCGAFFLPFGWGIAETLAALVVSWWVIYRTGLY